MTSGYGAGSGKDQLLAAVALEGEVSRMPLVGLAERDFTSLVVRLDAMNDLRHGRLPLPAAWRIQRRPTKDSSVSLMLRLPYHARCTSASIKGGPTRDLLLGISLCGASRKRGDVPQHRPEMASAPRYDEEVPQLVEPEHPRHGVRAPQPVDERARPIKQST